MALINRGLVDNVEAGYIETYLNQKGIMRADDAGIPVTDWVNKLLHNGDI